MAVTSAAMATPSYERLSASASLPDVKRAGSALEWQEWVNADDWQRQTGLDLSSVASETLGVSGGRAALGAMSLSQQQLHKQSTAREFGPSALGLFRQRSGSSSQRVSNGRLSGRSGSPTLMRVGFRGRMQQRATTVHSAPKLVNMNQGEWGAVMMQRSVPGMPQATWRDNRRRASADGRTPGLVPLERRSVGASPVAQQQQRARRQEELRQRRLQKQRQRQQQKRQPCKGQPQSAHPDSELETGSGHDQFSPTSTRSNFRAENAPSSGLRTAATTGANVSTSPPKANSTRNGSGSQSAGDFDLGYARKMALKSECAMLVKEGDTLIKQYAIEILQQVDDHELSKDSTTNRLLAQAADSFQKALAIDSNNLKARSGMKRAESLAAKVRRKARKIKGLELFQKRHGDNWRQMMSLDQEQTDEDLKAVFDMVDDDNSGHLDKDEVALVIEFFSCDKEVTDEDIDRAMAQMDADGSGEVDFDEFLRWWKAGHKGGVHFAIETATAPAPEPQPRRPRKLTRQESKAQMAMISSRDDFEDNLRNIFSKYDDDGSGEIDSDELMAILSNLGVTVTEQEVQAMVLEVDEDGSGTIDFEEFRAMVNHAMVDGSGEKSSALAMAMVEHSFNAIDNEIAWKWQRGMMVQLRNGLWAPVFSQNELEQLIADGAQLPDCVQG